MRSAGYNLGVLFACVSATFWVSVLAAEVFTDDVIEWYDGNVALIVLDALVTTVAVGLVYTAVFLPGAAIVLGVWFFLRREDGSPSTRVVPVLISPVLAVSGLLIAGFPEDLNDWLFFAGVGPTFAATLVARAGGRAESSSNG